MSPSRRNASLALVGLLSALTLVVTPALAAPRPRAGVKPIDPANMDTTIRPGDDFYRYANGKWMEHNPIPPDESRWGAFSEDRKSVV